MLVILQAIDPSKVTVPADTTIVKVLVRRGTICVQLELGRSPDLETWSFFAFNNGEYMSNPMLGYIDTITVGESGPWHIFVEDWPCTS